MQINIHQAKTQLSKLIQLVSSGEEVIIAKAGKPKVKLIAYKETLPKRKPGALKGKIWMSKNFDKTPKEVIDSFYNSKIFPDE